MDHLSKPAMPILVSGQFSVFACYGLTVSSLPPHIIIIVLVAVVVVVVVVIIIIIMIIIITIEGFASIEGSVDTSIQQLEDNIEKHKGGLITATRNATDNIKAKRMTIPRKQKWEVK